MIETKICRTCKQEKGRAAFRNQRTNKDGKKGFCIPCEDAWHKINYQKNREKRLEQQKAWNEAHPDKVVEYMRDYVWRQWAKGLKSKKIK